MFRLTREVRFAINPSPDDQLSGKPANSYGGFPSLTGIGTFLTLQITLSGDLDPASQYLRNIKDVDEVIRSVAIPRVEQLVREKQSAGFNLPAILFDQLKAAWPGAALHEIRLVLSPYLSVACLAQEYPMVRLSQKFEFSAAHRLHNPALDDATNIATFGKCNNPLGHGHNYEVQVTLTGEPDANGLLIDVPAFERTVDKTVIDKFDHKHLNVEVAEFKELIPSVENIARVIYRLLKPKFTDRTKLASVTVWETPKTWCEYSE